MKTVEATPDHIRRIIAEERALMLEHDRYVTVLLREANRMRAEGHSREEINEGLLDIITGIGGGFFETFKYQFGQWILSAIGLQPDGILSKIIANIFERADILDFKKYFKDREGCKEFTNVIMDSLGEATVLEPLIDSFVDKLGINPQSRMYASVREAITNSVMQGDLAEGIEDRVGEFVCNIDISDIFSSFKSLIPGLGGGAPGAPPAVPATP